MIDGLNHPGAKKGCRTCHGRGLRVVRDGALAVAVPCTCVGPCPLCAGSGFVAVGEGFRAPRRRCDCERVAQRARVFDAAQIPGRYADATLKSFKADGGLFAAFASANAYVARYKPGEENRGFVLHGKVGRGKTHLMVGILRELILRYGVTARFVEFTHLLADLKSSFGKGGGSDLIEPLAQVEVLAIDELGKGRNTEFEGTVLDELVSRRYNANAVVLATTNFEPKAATGYASSNLAADETLRNEPALIDRVGDRVFSRLREMTDFVAVIGEDWRESHRSGPGPGRPGAPPTSVPPARD